MEPAETDAAALALEAAILLRFPPFPAVPDGVELVPFHSFRPSGIRVPIDDDDDDYDGRRVSEDVIERDGLGIATVPLRVKHVADNMEKKKKRKKKGGGGGGATQQVQVAPERPKTWWELWEELEDIRRNAYDANMAPLDRLYQAGVEFKSGRTWPTASQGVQHVWDIFRIYIGLLQQTPAPAKDTTADATTEATPDAIPDADARSEDSDSDQDDDEADDALAGANDETNLMEAFLNDPELSMKVFFSSHFRERGFIWSEPRCVTTPILVSFFLRYLLRSRVFPEPEYDRPLKRALEIVELARVQLPNSWKMGRTLPDAFSDGCKGLWGSMQLMWMLPEDASSTSANEPEAKRPRLDDSEDARPQSPEKPSAADADAGTAEANTASAEGGWGTAAGGEEPEGWGTTPKSWGDTSAFASAEGGEGPLHDLDPPIWDASIVDAAQATWDLQPPTLIPLLGPSMLPLTHTTGVVEQSTRRIVRVDPPRLPRLIAQNAPAAEAVEEDLACRFARLILAPWDRLDKGTYEAGSDVLPPTVLSTSRGAFKLEEGEIREEGKGKVHRPWKDEICVLIDPKLTEVLLTGMGVGAIWVEIVRDKVGEESCGAGTSKKGKGKKKEVPKYWYMEQLAGTLQNPSFLANHHPMPFGEIVVGSPGSGKSTYCYGKHQLFAALNRPIAIVNLDPANDNIPYPCAIDIASLITLQDAMSTHGLGPNGGMLYCMEYLEANYDWLEDRLKELGKDAYVLFDLPGQVELSTNHNSLKRIIEKLGKSGFRLAAVHLCDSHLVSDAAKYVSVLLLSLRAMLHLELPHINVLSKIDLLTQYGDLDFNLDFYTEVQDLSYLENALSSASPRYTALNMAICGLIEDFGLVGFETLAVEDKHSMLNLTRAIDRATGYVFVPPAGTDAQLPEGAVRDPSAATSAQPNAYALMSSAMGPRVGGLRSDVRDVQERWVDAREEWDAHEKALWRREGEALGRAAAEVEKQRKLNIRERK